VMRLGFLHSQVVGASFRLSFGNGTETGLKDSEKKKKIFFFLLSLFLAAVCRKVASRKSPL
jgi:hypothetical protein